LQIFRTVNFIDVSDEIFQGLDWGLLPNPHVLVGGIGASSIGKLTYRRG
jgi:hypothetical protein